MTSRRPFAPTSLRIVLSNGIPLSPVDAGERHSEVEKLGV